MGTLTRNNLNNVVTHYVKSVGIRSFSGPYSVRMRENTEQKKPNTDIFHAITVVETSFQSHASAGLELDFKLHLVSNFFVQIRVFKIILANSNMSGAKKSK